MWESSGKSCIKHESRTWFKEEMKGESCIALIYDVVQRGKEWGKVVGKVVSHKSRTWLKEERKGQKY